MANSSSGESRRSHPTLRLVAEIVAFLWFAGISAYYYYKLGFYALALHLLGVGT